MRVRRVDGWQDGVSSAFTRYASFDGRARRLEFWGFSLFHGVVTSATWSVALVLALVGLGTGWTAAVVAALWWAAVAVTANAAFLLPSYAAAARRLHDTGRSAVWLLLVLVPYGGLYLYYPWCLDSTPGANEHGPNPKGVAAPPWWPAPAPAPWYPLPPSRT